MKARFPLHVVSPLLFGVARVLVLAVTITLLACGDTGVRGEIVGVEAKARFEEMVGGEIKSMSFAGNLVVLLPDGEQVVASCPEEFIPSVAGAPEFTETDVVGGFVATITVKLDQHQEVLLVQDTPDSWRVAEVLPPSGGAGSE